MDIDKIISIIRTLKEEAITNTSGTSSLGFNPESETPPVNKKKKKYIYGKGYRKLWQQK